MSAIYVCTEGLENKIFLKTNGIWVTNLSETNHDPNVRGLIKQFEDNSDIDDEE